MTDYFLLWDTIDRMLWGMAFALLIICGLMYIYRGKQKENSNERLIMYGFSSLFYGFTVYRVIIVFLQQLYMSSNGIYIDGAFYSEEFSLLTIEVPLISELLGRVSYICFTSGFVFFFYTFERVIKKTKYIMTILMILNVPLILFLQPYGIATILFSTLTFSMAIMISCGILLYYAIKSRLEFKAIASLILIAISLAGGSTTFANPDLMKFEVMPIYVAPITMIIAAIIGIAPTIIDPEYFSRALGFWIFCASVIFSLLISLTILFIIWSFNLGLELYFSMNTSIYIIIDIFLFRIIFKNILQERKGIVKRQDDSTINVLGIFSKPKSLTEEEVSLYRDKAVCLVCKGKIDGISYICGNCRALYCEKCLKALIDLENMCWACDSPLDKSKPVKKLEEQEEEVKKEELKIGKKFPKS